MAVTSGLSADDLVVLAPAAGVVHGVEVQTRLVEEAQSPRGEDVRSDTPRGTAR